MPVKVLILHLISFMDRFWIEWNDAGFFEGGKNRRLSECFCEHELECLCKLTPMCYSNSGIGCTDDPARVDFKTAKTDTSRCLYAH